MLSENGSTCITAATRRWLENVGADRLYLIEARSGDSLGQDDIVRFEDGHKRT